MGSIDLPEGYWDSKPGDMFAQDTDLTMYWPWVRPCWEESWNARTAVNCSTLSGVDGDVPTVAGNIVAAKEPR